MSIKCEFYDDFCIKAARHVLCCGYRGVWIASRTVISQKKKELIFPALTKRKPFLNRSQEFQRIKVTVRNLICHPFSEFLFYYLQKKVKYCGNLFCRCLLKCLAINYEPSKVLLLFYTQNMFLAATFLLIYLCKHKKFCERDLRRANKCTIWCWNYS